MRRRRRCALPLVRAFVLPVAGLLATVAGSPVHAQTAPAPAPATAPAAAPHFSAEECAVFERELGFARSVAEHDAAAFAEHVHEYAAFGASRAQPLRGRTAIVRGWDGIIRGTAVVLSWYPTRVTLGQGDGAPAVAWSSGPALFENPDPAATDRYALGEFHSVWHKGGDGQWRVLFDDGVAPRPATPAQVAAFRAARPAACPRS